MGHDYEGDRNTRTGGVYKIYREGGPSLNARKAGLSTVGRC